MTEPTYRPGDIAMVDGSVHVLDGAGYFTCIETGEVVIADESTSCGPALGNVADIAAGLQFVIESVHIEEEAP